MADPVKLCSVLPIKHLWGEFQAFELHMYYHMRRVLKRLQVPLPHKAGFSTADNPYSNQELFKLCRDYNVSHDPMRYSDEKFCWISERC